MENSKFYLISVVVGFVIGAIYGCTTILQWGICIALTLLGFVILRVLFDAIIALVAWMWWKKHGTDVEQKIKYRFYRLFHPLMNKEEYDRYFKEKYTNS